MKKRSTIRRKTGKIRLIGGKHGGRRLSFPLLEGVRPTPERVRETIFNWLAGYVEGACCLDLCCGSGALGLEALSRGAASLVLVDSSAAIIKNLRHNLLELKENAETVQLDASTWLAQQADTKRYDIIFLDPPYQSGLLAPLCQKIAAKDMLTPGGHIYLETMASAAWLDLPDPWTLVKQKRAGEVLYTLCEYTLCQSSRPTAIQPM